MVTSMANSIFYYLKNFSRKVISFHQLQTNSNVTTEPLTSDVTSVANQSELELEKRLLKARGKELR